MKDSFLGFALSLALYDIFNENDYQTINATIYNQNKSWFAIEIEAEDQGNPDTDVALGVLWGNFGIGYQADTDALDEGWITISLGAYFN